MKNHLACRPREKQGVHGALGRRLELGYWLVTGVAILEGRCSGLLFRQVLGFRRVRQCNGGPNDGVRQEFVTIQFVGPNICACTHRLAFRPQLR